MPLYSVTCNKCKYTRDLLLRSPEDIPKDMDCNKCDGSMSRDFSAEKPNFQLKGGGWATSGYGRSDREMVKESDKEILATEKQRIKEDKAKGIY